MDTLSHAILGATLARATATGPVSDQDIPIKTRVWIGGLAAAFPDADYLSVFLNPLLFISDWHRAETHSLLLLPLWALLMALVFSSLLDRRAQWQEFGLICGLSLCSHILTDILTIWGTQIFAPLSDYRASWGTTFLIDPYFTLIILAGLLLALRQGTHHAAQVAVVLLVIYIGCQVLLKSQAQTVGENYAIQQDWRNAQIEALPQPYSPFHWKLLIRRGEHYQLAYVDLIGSDDKPLPDKKNTSLWHGIYTYRPRKQLDWVTYQHYGPGSEKDMVKSVWQHLEMAPYRRFARFPALYRIDRSGTSTCVWFMDLRFILPQLDTPFRYGMCKGTTGKQVWQLRRMSGA